MTHKNIFAYTATTQSPYPGYVSINDDEDGSYSITVRSPGNGGRDIGQVIVSSELLASMATAIQQHQLNTSSASIQSPSAQADQRIEAELVAAGLNAPRITADHIQALMDQVVYHYENPQGTTSTFAHAYLDGFYLASGYSACVSASNFDAAKGQKYAKEQAEPKARDKLWELEGYDLHKRLRAAS